ncbi:bifunctional metallophosphatase/5'-nucleotidase [Lachnotalea glycerini]|uniref:Bifunctional metallophosphatase/5'-nucleotidase n=1 Tax=Lachnotalea glycerini TaxID=1763509 RepID=A0A371J877_9FIRM|nr:bifunctional UDP-sugar hydrolase/5'-nucleotidase [Lachnotalea glycerini]RDY28867.1 bifunctional metallophosphatase/5'-nucleotidase [Lachnotalea glycerini]
MRNSIKIYYTSDIHGYFFPTSYADKKVKEMGLFQCANQFKKDGNTLIIDGGDMLQGSAFAYYCQNQIKSNQIIAQIMNSCGYDYVTIGNHDFNYGQDYLKDYIKSLNAKCVCQNVKDLNNNYLYPYDIKMMENGMKVGIVGLVTDYVNIWEKKENLEHLNITDTFKEAQYSLEQLRNQVDITLCIYHGGFERNLETGELLSETSENIAYRICKELDFDLLLTGHQHMSIHGQYVHHTYVLQPKENGVEYHVAEISVENKDVKIQSRIEKPKRKEEFDTNAFYLIETKVQSWLEKKVGELTKALMPESKLKMASEGNEIASFINYIQLYYSKAQISVCSLPNDVKGFDKIVTRRDIIATYPYPNTLVVLEMTGEDVKAAIERSAEYFQLNDRGELTIAKQFLEPKTEHYNYDYYAGIEYQIDPAQKPGERVSLLKYHQKNIAEEDIFLVCINNYRASGAGGYSMYPKCKKVKEINTEMVELILNFFETHQNTVTKIPKKKRIVTLK